jgi:hypothetical protein
MKRSRSRKPTTLAEKRNSLKNRAIPTKRRKPKNGMFFGLCRRSFVESVDVTDARMSATVCIGRLPKNGGLVAFPKKA